MTPPPTVASIVVRAAVVGPSTPPPLRPEVDDPAGYRRSRFGPSTLDDAEPVNPQRLPAADPPAPEAIRAYGIDSREAVAPELRAPEVGRVPPAFAGAYDPVPAACGGRSRRQGTRVYDGRNGRQIAQSVHEAARVLDCSASAVYLALRTGGSVRGVPLRSRPDAKGGPADAA